MTVEVQVEAESAPARAAVQATPDASRNKSVVRLAASHPSLVTRAFPWIRDSIVLASVLAGGLLFDARLAIAGPISLNQILSATVLALIALHVCKSARIDLRNAHTLLLVAALTSLLAIRAIGSPNTAYAQFKVAGYAAMVLPLIAFMELHVRTPADLRRWLRITSLAALALVLLGIPHMLAIEGGQRLAVLGGGPNTLARHIGTGSIAALVLLAMHRTRARLLITGAGLLLAATALLLTGTKAVMLSLAVTSLFVLTRLGHRRALAIVLLGVVLLALLPVVTHDLVRDQPKDGGLVRLLRMPDVDDPLGSYGSRLRFVGSTWHELRTSPWLGAGTGGWGLDLGFGWDQAYPHNIVLEVLGETGLVGLALLGCVVARWIRAARRRSGTAAARPSGALAVGLEALLVFWSINVMLSGDLVDSRYFWLWLCMWELYRRRMCPCPSQA